MEHPAIQGALLKGPGDFACLQVWRRAAGAGAGLVREVASELLARPCRGEEVETLVGVAPHVLGLEDGQGVLPWAGVPPHRGSLLLQYAASSRESLLRAVHEVAARVAGALVLDDEMFGGKLGDGREPFGYRDGLVIPTPAQIRDTARIESGPLEGGSWVLAIRFQQDTHRFLSLTRERQDEVFGRRRDGALVEPLPPSSHVARQRAVGASARLVRRGFPFRSGGEDGLAFVAASRKPELLAGALEVFTSSGSAPDGLARYCVPVLAGLYLAPPDARWLARPERRTA